MILAWDDRMTILLQGFFCYETIRIARMYANFSDFGQVAVNCCLDRLAELVAMSFKHVSENLLFCHVFQVNRNKVRFNYRKLYIDIYSDL